LHTGAVERSREHVPLVGALALAGTIFAVLWYQLRQVTGGTLVYALDDPYIHMAIARNLAQHAVWGISPDSFASSSSSPLWTAALGAVFFLTGVHVVWPLVLNLVFVGLLLFVADRRLARDGVPSGLRFAWLSALVLFVPLAPLTFAGLEHVLHALLTILFLGAAAEWLARRDDAAVFPPRRLLLLAPLVGTARYEGLFAVGVVVLAALWLRRWRGAILLGAVGAAPTVVLGAISTALGWYPLPNPVLAKNAIAKSAGALTAHGLTLRGIFDVALGTAVRQLVAAPHLLVAFLAMLGLAVAHAWQRGTFRQRESLALGLLAAVAFVHVSLARTGWFYRYEAYLLAATYVFAAAPAVAVIRGGDADGRRLGIWVRLAAVLLALGVPAAGAVRGVRGTFEVPRAARDIYRQQLQSARFVSQYYDGQSIALNDIGAVAFFTNARCLDLVGLASRDVLALKLRGRLDSRAIEQLGREHGVKLAIVYERWFSGRTALPPSWTIVGRWKIPERLVSADDTVAICAVGDGELTSLRENLRAFTPSLPPGVRYLEGSGGSADATPRLPEEPM
jgi:hypothetical protein